MCEISIIVPIYKVERYLKRCVDSILNQTFTDFELILVDDGSPDNCGRICDEYAEKDNRIYVIHKENGGLSDARNAGLDYATGQYIIFVDSDDFVEPDLLEKAYNTIIKGYDIVSFGLNIIDEDENVSALTHSDAGKEFKFEKQDDYLAFILRIFMNWRVGWEAWSRIYRRDIIEKYGLRFEDNSRIFAEDMYFNLCYIVHTKTMYAMKDCLYNYLRRNDSIMGNDIKKSNLNRFNELAKAVLVHYKRYPDLDYLCEHFSAIYYMIMYHEMKVYYKKETFDCNEYRDLFNKEIADKDFMRMNLKSLKKENNLMYLNFPKGILLRIYNNINYVLDGNLFKYKIKNGILNVVTSVKDKTVRKS